MLIYREVQLGGILQPCIQHRPRRQYVHDSIQHTHRRIKIDHFCLDSVLF